MKNSNNSNTQNTDKKLTNVEVLNLMQSNFDRIYGQNNKQSENNASQTNNDTASILNTQAFSQNQETGQNQNLSNLLLPFLKMMNGQSKPDIKSIIDNTNLKNLPIFQGQNNELMKMLFKTLPNLNKKAKKVNTLNVETNDSSTEKIDNYIKCDDYKIN